MNFAPVEQIAAAILYEGYILYPYRKTAVKNRQRWNFGTLYPRIYAEHQRPQEPFRLVAEFLVKADADAFLDLRISFLQLVRQTTAVVADKLSDPLLAWDEAVERTTEHGCIQIRDLLAAPFDRLVHLAGTTLPRDESGVCSADLQAHLSIAASLMPDGCYKLQVVLENVSAMDAGEHAKRDEVLPQAFVSAHLIAGITRGEFISLLDPPPAFAASVAACTNVGVFPVLAGEEPARNLLLCSPIILYDYPKTAPESEGDFFDGTEMDEMLTLRVLTLTEPEKEEMRQGDPRARRILERTEALTGEAMLKAHGVIRSLRELREDIP